MNRIMRGCQALALVLAFGAYGCGGEETPEQGDTDSGLGDTLQSGGDTLQGDPIPQCIQAYDEVASALAVTPGTPINSETVCPDASLFLALTLTEDSLVTISAGWATDDDLDLYIYNSAMEDVSYSWWTNPEFQRLALRAGTYYIEVEGYDIAGYTALPVQLEVDALPYCYNDGDCSGSEYCRLLYTSQESWPIDPALASYGYVIGGECRAYTAPTGDPFGTEDGGAATGDVYRLDTPFALTAPLTGGKLADIDQDVFRYTAPAQGTLAINMALQGVDADVLIFHEASGTVTMGARASLVFEGLTFGFVPDGAYTLVVSTFGWHEVDGDEDTLVAGAGQYTLTVTHTAETCATDKNCREKAPDRPTCVLAAGDPPDSAGDDVGLCIDYVPTAPGVFGAFCDSEDDCADGICRDASPLYHSDNMCSAECDPLEEDECPAESSCSPFEWVCVNDCTHLDECVTGTLCMLSSGDCVLNACRVDDTCDTVFSDPTMTCDVLVERDSYGDPVVFRGCAFPRDPATCAIDDAAREPNDSFSDAFALPQLEMGANGVNGLYACPNSRDFFLLTLPSAAGAKDVKIQVINTTNNGYFLVTVIDDQNGRSYAGQSETLAETTFTFTQDIRNLAPDSHLLVGIDRLPWRAEDEGWGGVLFTPETSSPDTATPYLLTVTVSAALDPCADAEDCYTDDFARTVCNTGACSFDVTLSDFGSAQGERCVDGLDCDLILDPYQNCSLTKGNLDRNVCTPACDSDTDCAAMAVGPTEEWTCVSYACVRIDCVDAADCPVGFWQYYACGAGTCSECGVNADCVEQYGEDFPICDNAAYDGTFTCGMCGDDTDCTDSSCIFYEDWMSGSSYKICGCETDDDCPDNMVCDWEYMECVTQ